MTSRPILVIADDQAENLLLLEAMLQEDYEVRTFPDGTDVQLYLKQGGRADIFLLDIVMPHLDGFSLCRQIKANATTRELPVIFITALDSPDVEARGLALGAVDFIHKPFSMPGIKARLRTHLQLAATSRQLREQNENLEALVAQRTREYMEQTRELLQRKQQVISGQEATIRAFCSLAEARDNETGNHIRRTQHYVEALARKLQDHPRFRDELTEDAIQVIFKSAPLHDIGKVGIPDRILLKPGKLTPPSGKSCASTAASAATPFPRWPRKWGKTTISCATAWRSPTATTSTGTAAATPRPSRARTFPSRPA